MNFIEHNQKGNFQSETTALNLIEEAMLLKNVSTESQ